MRKIEPELITGMGYIGDNPGVLYRMGGAGEQTVVTGNPALLEGVKGSRITALTLHGGSTQGSTTGAQLLNTKELITGYYDNSGGITILDARLSAPKIHIPTGTTKISISGLADNISALYVVENAEGAVIERNVGYKKQHTISISPESKTIGVSFYNDAGIRITADMLSSCMINFGDIKPFEPYTGGAPSPSPSYPQEIENAGQSGEIGVEVLGKNLIPFPYSELGGAGTQVEKNGVKYTVQTDGGIRCVGTPTSVFGVTLTKIRFSDIQLSVQNPTDGKVVLSGRDLFFDFNNNSLFVYFKASQLGKPIDTVIYPQIELGTVATEYEPYKPAQKLIIPTPGGLPGIPVSSGGNYTDKDGQQWVADEIDLANGERVKWIGKTVVDGGKMKFVDYPDSNFWNLPHKTSPGIIEGTPCTSRYFAEGIFEANSSYDFIYTTPKKMKPYFDTPEELNAFCVQKNSEGNPLTIYYCMDTPIRTPLPPETIAAYKALRTYSPTTTVINDAVAGMSVGYKGK